MAKKKFYAVRVGRKPGIYENWYGDDGALAQVDGYKQARYKSFPTLSEAEAFLTGEDEVLPHRESGGKAKSTADLSALSEPYAFTDGSFNLATGVYGFGGFLVADGERHTLQGSGDDAEAAASRNVAGEVMGAMAAVSKAKELGLTKLTICYDYEGVARWARGEWKTNKTLTKEYAAFMSQSGLAIDFLHVKAHTGIEGNEEADRLAKEAVGITV